MPYFRRVIQPSFLPWESLEKNPSFVLESFDEQPSTWSPVEGEVMESFLDDDGRAWHLIWLDEAITIGGETFAYVLAHKVNPTSPLDEATVDVHLLPLSDPKAVEEATREFVARQGRAHLKPR